LDEISTPPVWVQVATLAIFGEGVDDMIDEQTVPSGIGRRQMVGVALAWKPRRFTSAADHGRGAGCAAAFPSPGPRRHGGRQHVA
jgi:hypothetical protein